MKVKKNSVAPAITRSAVAAAVATALTVPAMAQDSGSAIEEVIVTATKRESSVQDLAVSVTAIDGAKITELGMVNVIDLEKTVPGVKVRYVGADPSIIMRGAGTAGTNDIAVPIYVDGLYRPRGGQALASYLDLERIEVLRGPQGTLFGRNTLGGLVNIIAKKPQTDEFDYGVGATFGDYSYQKIEGFVNVPFGEKVAMRIAASDTQRDPLIENVYNSSGGMRDEDNTYVRAQLAFYPTDDLDITFTGTYWEDTSNGNADYAGVILGIPVNPDTGLTDGIDGVMQPRQGRLPTGTGNWSPTGGRSQAGIFGVDESANVIPDVYKIASDFEPLREIEETSFSALVNWDFGPVALRANIGVFEYEEFRLTDSDFSQNPKKWGEDNPNTTPPTSTGPGYWQQCWGGVSCGLAAGQRVNSDAIQADINLNSTGDGNLQWTLGYFLYDDSGNGDTTSEFVWGYTDSTAPQNISWGHWLYQSEGGTKSTAIYGQAEYSFNDTTRATVGLRHSTDERSIQTNYVDWGPSVHGYGPTYYADHYADPGSRFAPWPEFVETQASIDNRQTGEKSNTDWKFALQHDVSDDVMLFASAASGYIAGAIEGGGSTNLTDPNEVLALETGMKSTLLDGTMRMNISLFHNDYKGLTTSSFVAQGATIVAVQNVGGSMTATGVEVEMNWAPTDELYINAGISLLDATLDKFGRSVLNRVFRDGGDDIQLGSGITDPADCDQTCSQIYRLNGEDARFSPDYTFQLDASYRFDMGGAGTLTPGIYLYASDDYKTTNIPYFFTQQDSYVTYDLRATWEAANMPIAVQGFILNAGDETYQVGGDQFSEGRAVADFNNPRTWGIRVSYNF